MQDRLSRLESELHEVERQLAGVEQRLIALERDHMPVPAPASAVGSADAALGATSLPRDEVGATISFLGRTFVALGGAYFLRALTDSAVVPQRVGIALGIGYALAWIAAADRAGARGRRLSAGFHALVACLVGFPLIWEATVRFKDLSPAGGALVLAAVTIAAIGVALHRDLRPVAWIATLGALPTAIATVSVTGALLPFAVFLIVLGLITLWIGYARDWIWLRWPVALVTDVSVFALTMGPGATTHPAEIVAVQMLLLNGYLASIVVRTIVRARDVIGFEILQTLASLTIGFGGAVYVARRSGSDAALLAMINLAFGVACYGVALVFMRQGRPRNFYFYSSLALILVIISSMLLLTPSTLAVVSVLLAIVAAWSAGRFGAVTLTVHAIAYLMTAGLASGLLAAAGIALVGPASARWLPFTTAAIVTLAGYAACWLLSAQPRAAPVSAHVPAAIVAVLVVWAGAGTLVAWLTALVSSTPALPDAGILATTRTAVLAVAAMALAWAGRHDRYRASAWLLYPLLAAGGVKLLVEDLPLSPPAALFVALAVYGLALIAAPRLSRPRTL